MLVYLVIQETSAHEPDPVMSVWSTEELANKEKDRLDDVYRKYDMSYMVVPVELDKQETENRLN